MTTVSINGRWDLDLPEHRNKPDWWQNWESERLASLAEHLDDGGHRVLYIGAEQGDMPALIATWGNDVVLVEPVAEVWPTIRHIFEANGVADRVIGSFVGFSGDTDRGAHENLHFGWPDESTGEMTDIEMFAHLNERHDLPVITPNTIASMLVPRPDAVSMDVEGAEFNVLAGSGAVLLTEIRPKIWVSIHPDFMRDRYGHTVDELTSFVEAHGYTGVMLADTHEQHWLFIPNELLTGDDLADSTKSDLYQRAQELDIAGRSTMTQEELAVAVAEATSTTEIPPGVKIDAALLGNAKEVTAWITDNADFVNEHREALLTAEETGKNRKTILAALRPREETPDAAPE